MFARVHVLTGGTDAVLTVPRTAITFYPYGDSVFVISDEQGDLTVVRRQINTGRVREGRVEITSGLEQSERVVSTGQFKLRSGQRVTIDNSIVLPAEVTGR